MFDFVHDKNWLNGQNSKDPISQANSVSLFLRLTVSFWVILSLGNQTTNAKNV